MRRFLLLTLLIPAALTQAEAVGPAARAPLTIGLGANGETETEIFPGTPLTIEASLDNGPALEAETAKAVLARMKASLDAAVADGEVTREQADAWLAVKRRHRTARALTVRPVKARFRFTGPDGAALPWVPRMLSEKDEAVVLDGARALHVTFVVSPEQSAALQPGELRLVLHYDGQGAAAGEWAGEAASEEVVVRVVARPAALTPEQTWTEARAASDYHLATQDWDAALADAQAMVQAVPEAPGGYVRLARARERKGDERGPWRRTRPPSNTPSPWTRRASRPSESCRKPSVCARPWAWRRPGRPPPRGRRRGRPRPHHPRLPRPLPPTPRPRPRQRRGRQPPQPYNSQDPDAQRQWAVEATASSQYSAEGGSARQAVGPPDTPRYADAQTAWYPTPSDDGVQWLQLTYRYVVVPRRIEVHESFGAGAVTRVLMLPEGADPNAWVVLLDQPAPGVPAAPAAPVVTSVEVGENALPTRRVRVEVNTAVPGWNEIDAVALVGRYVTGVPNGSPGVFRWWAETATASSQYGAKNNAASQAVGPPDTLTPGDRPTAWAPGNKDGGAEWLEVTYPAPLVPAELNIHENCGPGAVVRVEAREEATGRWATLWEGQDPTVAPAGVFSPALTANTFAARVFRVHLDTSVPGWNEIDAVELVGNPPASR